MVQKYIQALKAFFSNTEKSTLAVFAVGAIALLVAVPLSSSVQDDVVTLSEDDAAQEQQEQQEQQNEGGESSFEEKEDNFKEEFHEDFNKEDARFQEQFEEESQLFKDDQFKDQFKDKKFEDGRSPDPDKFGQFGDPRMNQRSKDIGVGPPSKDFHGAPVQRNQFGPVDPEQGNRGPAQFQGNQNGNFGENRGPDNFEDRQNGNFGENRGPGNFEDRQNGNFGENRGPGNFEGNQNGEFDAQNQERMQQDLAREKTRLQRDYKWTLRDLERAGMQDEIAKYNEYIKQAEACTDYNCVEDVRWALDDWSFAVQDTINASRCTQDAERMEREMSRQTMQMEKEISRVERDFGSEAASEFRSIVSEMKALQSEMVGLAKECKWNEVEDLRFEKEFDIQDRMHAFWEEWGQKNFMAHEEDMCTEVQDEIARAETEKLANVPEANKAAARALLQQAKAYAAECNFAELEKLSFQAKRLGLSDDDDSAVRGYREIRKDDIRGFEGHEDELEDIFSDLDARNDNIIYERLTKADRANVNRVLQDDDEEFKKRKLIGLKNFKDEKKANEFLQANVELKELLDQVAALKAEIASLKSEIARINFHPSIAEQVKKDLEAGTLTERELEEFKAESREAKFEDGTIPFKDFDDDTYYLDAVKRLKEEGIVKGKEEGVYDPGASTTIAEGFKIAFETLGLGYSDGETGVPAFDNHWAKGYFKKAQEKGVPTFDRDINRPITRGELAELIVKAKGMAYENTERPVFSDVNQRHPYYNAIQTLNANGVFNGSDGKARPDDPLNRAEIATFMNNVINNLR